MSGVWRIAGGMYDLAKEIESISKNLTHNFFKNKVKKILMKNNKINGIELNDNKVIHSNTVIFNGDPKLLLRWTCRKRCDKRPYLITIFKRSLSAYVWSFAAKTKGLKLRHHNVLFNKNYKNEFEDIKKGEIPKDPTLYVAHKETIMTLGLRKTFWDVLK